MKTLGILTGNNSRSGLARLKVILLTVLASFLVCLGLAWLSNARQRARSICCNCNLKQIGLAFRVWANDHQDQNPMQVSVTNGGTLELINRGNVFPHFQVMSNELNSPVILVCPEDSQRQPTTNFITLSDANVSYFVGVDARDSLPQMFLSGDGNLATNGVPLPHGIHTISTNQILTWAGNRHRHGGNIGLADGSVQGFSNASFTNGWPDTRLAMP
jgi:prepilin-type processing-associated H-X9-DG protein